METSILVGAILACEVCRSHPHNKNRRSPNKAMSMEMDKQMQKNMEKMQQQMDTLRTTTDAGERQKLMQEHRKMRAMRGMGGQMMMGGRNGGAMMDGHPKRRQEMLKKTHGHDANDDGVNDAA